jgi:DNA polymerase-3 subunit gamma/tau
VSYYHRYRPTRFADLVGQDHIFKILQTALRTGNISHAYLFSGSRGTGKTTTARLLAKTINCEKYSADKTAKKSDIEPCGECVTCKAIADSSCIDVIEIDAASNRGIEEIRSLQEQIRFRPQQARKKVFIIDEVHMLTKEAFNALLKTLEEPPDHLIFILATTEVHKLPLTVISRCQRFDFFTPNGSVIATYLKRIADSEKIDIDTLAIDRLAELARGSFRDSATLLEQLAASNEKISEQSVVESLGLPEASIIDSFLEELSGNHQAELAQTLGEYFARGGNAVAFIDTAFQELQRQLLSGKRLQAGQILDQLTRIKWQMKHAPLPSLPILVAAQGVVVHTVQPAVRQVAAPVVVEKPKPALPTPPPEPAPKPTAKSEAPKPPIIVIDEVSDTPPVQEMVTVEVAEQVAPLELSDTELGEKWQKVLTKLHEDTQSSMVAILRTAKPLKWQRPVLTIGVQFTFHSDQLQRQKNRGIVEAALSDVFEGPVRIEMEVQPMSDLATAAADMF